MKGSFIHEWLVVGLMAMIFILAGKLVFTKFNIPGVTDLFQAV
jgi:hypothetical protein